MRLALVLLAACAGSMPAPVTMRPALEPVQRWCAMLWTANAGYEVCTQQRANCDYVRAGAFQFGAYAGVEGVGECVAR